MRLTIGKTENTFNTNDNATRAQTAQMLYRFISVDGFELDADKNSITMMIGIWSCKKYIIKMTKCEKNYAMIIMLHYIYYNGLVIFFGIKCTLIR